jgi:hypothetical protein
MPNSAFGRLEPLTDAAAVLAYIASLPQPQRGIAERVDALAAMTLPGLQRSVKWGISYYGVGDVWCFCCGGFADHQIAAWKIRVAAAPASRRSRRSGLWFGVIVAGAAAT